MDERRDSPKYKTCRRYNVPGHAHALTFSCFRRQPFLSKDRTREWLCEAIDRARRELTFDVWAYVVMPEHCHLLILPRSATYSVSRILEAVKLPVARRAIAWVKRHAPDKLIRMRDEQPGGAVAHRFWQRGGGFDQNLVSEHWIYATMDYIHANPVRRGLCERPEEWRWSSAPFYAGDTDVPLVPDTGSLPTAKNTE